MTSSSLRLKVVLGVILASVLLAAVALWRQARLARKSTAPKDSELIAAFYADPQVFKQVQEMAAEDSRRGWYLGASEPSNLDQSRQEEYKRLVSQIHPGLLVAMNGRTGVVRFILAIEGTAIGPGWVKGIEYVPSKHEWEGEPLPNLDQAATLPASVYIREIEPNWFIFYQRDE